MRGRRLGIDAGWFLPVVTLVALVAGTLYYAIHGPPAPKEPKREPAGAPPRVVEARPAPAGDGAILVDVLLRGRPAPAEVEIFALDAGDLVPPPAGPAVFVAGAGPEGRATFAPAPAGFYEVRARDAGGRAGATRVSVALPGARVLARIGLPGGECVLAGRAVHADGTPFRGGIVAFTSRLGIGEPAIPFETAPAPTDDGGRFDIGGLVDGLVMLRAAAPDGFVARAGPFRIPNAAEVVLVVDEGFTDLAGQVLDAADGRPVAGAEVRFRGGSQVRSATCLARTDVEGRFRVRRPPRDGSLEVEACGFTMGRLSVPADRASVDVRISRAAIVGGLVVAAADGAPLPGVTVRATAETSVLRFPSAMTTSGPEGRFELPLRGAGRARVLALGAGWASAAVEADVAPGARAEVRLTADRAARLTGAVLDETGAGLGGVPVAVMRQDIETVTEADGTFVLETLPPREGLELVASPAGRAEVVTAVRTGGPGETVHVELRAPAGRAVEVTVIEEGTGAPIPGVAVVVVSFSVAPSRHHAVTGPDGVARFAAIPPTRLSFGVEATRHWLVTSLPDLPPSPADVSLRVELRRGLTIAGRVLRPGGAPAVGCQVEAMGEENADFRGLDYAGSTTDEAGTFRLGPLAPGDYRIRAEAEGERGSTQASAGAEDVVVELSEAPGPEGEILTFVVLDGSERPVPSARVFLRPDGWLGGDEEVEVVDGRGWRSVMDADIRYEVGDARDASGLPLPLGRAIGGPVRAPGTITVRLPPERVVAGHVLGPDGEPVRGLRLEAWPADGPGQRLRATTGERGEFAFRGLGDGESVWIGTSRDRSERVVPGTTELVLRLAAEDVMAIRAVDPEGRPVPGTRFGYGADTPMGGPEGDLLLWVRSGSDTSASSVLDPPPDRPDLMRCRVFFSGGSVREVVLPRGHCVRGFVRDDRGVAVPGVAIVASQGADDCTGETLADGSFELGPFPEGSVTVRIDRERPQFWTEESLTVPAGQDGVVLRHREGLPLLVRVTGSLETDDIRPAVSADLTEDGTGEHGEDTGAKDGTFLFRDLPPDRSFTFWFRGVSGIVHLPGLRPGQRCEAEPRPGLTLRVRLVAAEGEVRISSTAVNCGPWVVHASTVSGPRQSVLTFPDLPDAPCELRIDATLDGRPVEIRQPVHPSAGTVEIPLLPR